MFIVLISETIAQLSVYFTKYISSTGIIIHRLMTVLYFEGIFEKIEKL